MVHGSSGKFRFGESLSADQPGIMHSSPRREERCPRYVISQHVLSMCSKDCHSRIIRSACVQAVEKPCDLAGW